LAGGETIVNRIKDRSHHMLGFDNPIHILFLLLLLLLVFGAKRLPEMGRSLGTGLRGFKDALTSEHGNQSEVTQLANNSRPTSTDVPTGDHASR
jgi:sec-independent protein translocase protein TatA